MNRKVFIPNLPTRHDEATQQRVPSLDLNPAAQFGELVTLTEGALHDLPALHRARDAIRIATMKDLRPQDCILCVGDVALTALCIAHALARNGHVTLLRWDRNKRSYDAVEVEA